MSAFTFKASDAPVDDNDGSFEPLPAGWYTANITGTELKDTKDGTGKYIAMRYDITGPTHQGRVIFDNINIVNKNPKAEDIGRRDLGKIMKAVKLEEMNDTDELCGKSLGVKLKIEPAKDGYDAKNRVAAFKPSEGNASSPPAPNGGKAESAGVPWNKK